MANIPVVSLETHLGKTSQRDKWAKRAPGGEIKCLGGVSIPSGWTVALIRKPF
jgi:hypothetical protein